MNSIFPILTEQVYSLPFYVHSLGIQPEQNEVIREAGVIKNQIAYCLKGQGYIDVKGEKRIINEGDIFFLKKGIAHGYGPSCNEFVVKWILFDGELSGSVLSSLGYEAFMLWKLHNIGELEELFQEIYELLFKQKDQFQYITSTKLYELIIYLKQDREQPKRQENHIISEPMVRFIEDYYYEDLSLERISETISRSVYHACKIFKRDTHTTMLKYLEDIRMKHAKRLLLLDDFSHVEQVAREVGYNSSNYFCRVFKKNEGLSPVQFRISMRGNSNEKNSSYRS